MKKLVIGCLLALPVSTIAQCCSGGVPMSNNIGLPPAEAKTLQVNLTYDWNNLKTLKSGDRNLEDENRQRETHSFLLETGYTFSKKISVDLFVPFIRQERTISTRATPDKQDTNGIGDVVILPKYSLSNGWLIGVGVKLSTGKANFLSNRAIALPADLQPGSGATDALFFTSYQRYSEERPSLSYFGNAIFRITGTNTNYFAGSSYRFGSELQMALGIADRFFLFGQLIDPSLGISYRKRGTDFFD
ncbi:MAG: hypothetical protein AAF551_09695, partial [Bacteroidota bacterium]